jgi:integrase
MGRERDGIREASASSYEISFTYMGVRCRERIRVKPSPTGLRLVKNFVGALRESIDKGTFDYSTSFSKSPRRLLFAGHSVQGQTVGEYLEKWVKERMPQLKDSTAGNYEGIVRRILVPAIGKIGLEGLKRSHVKEMLAESTAGNKWMTNIQSVLRTALQDAVMDETLQVNPMRGWTFKKKDAPKAVDDVDPFSKDEQSQILHVMPSQVHNFFKFAFWTGLRTSELVALDWDDIDWHRKELFVRRAITRNSKKPETTKTKSSTRRVKLLAPAYGALVEQKEHTYLVGREVFQNPKTGVRWTGDQQLRMGPWRIALRKSKVRYRRPYQTRHTYASMMLSAGESPMWVAQQMGHKDWGMIRHRYGKYMPDAIPDAGEKAVEIYGENAVRNAVIGSKKQRI